MKQLEGRGKEHRGRENGAGGGRKGEEERRGEEKEWRPVSRTARFSTDVGTRRTNEQKTLWQTANKDARDQDSTAFECTPWYQSMDRVDARQVLRMRSQDTFQ